MDKDKQDELFKLLHDIGEVSKEYQSDITQLRESQLKMTNDLEALATSQKEFKTDTETALVDLKDETEAEKKSLYDFMVEGKIDRKVGEIWGFKNPIERALYTPKTMWSITKGWQKTGEYELDNNVFLLNDFLYIYGMQKTINEQEKNPGSRKSYKDFVTETGSYKMFKYELERHSELRKALNTATSGEGSDWVPTGMSAQVIDDIRLGLKVAGMFGRITIPLGMGSFELPIRGERRRMYLKGQATSDDPSKIPATTPPTDKVTMTAVGFGLRMIFTDEFQEDSAIAAMPLIQSELVQAGIDAEEDSCINGDTTTTHQDSNVTALNDIRRAYSGLRYHSGLNSGNAAVDISGVTQANFRSMWKAMGRFGGNVNELFWLTSFSGFVQMAGISEVMTVDKLGAQASLLNGQMAAYNGSPVIVSEFIAQDMTGNGYYDGSTTTQTVVMLVNKTAFRFGDKPGGLKVETGRDIEKGISFAVATRRMDFKQVVIPGTSEESVAYGYNLAS